MTVYIFFTLLAIDTPPHLPNVICSQYFASSLAALATMTLTATKTSKKQ